MVVDIFLLYSFIKRLATPFVSWKAFEQGLIDQQGNILIPRKEMTPEQKGVFGLFDLLILNLKKLLAKLPGGSSQIATFAAALWLLKESDNEPSEEEIEGILQRMVVEHEQLTEALQINGTLLVEEEGGVPTNNTTNIANKEGPLLTHVKKTAIKKRNKARVGEVGA